MAVEAVMAITPRSFCGAHSPAYMMWIFRPKPAATNDCQMGQYKLLAVWCFGIAKHIGLGSKMFFTGLSMSLAHTKCVPNTLALRLC